jgi:hypothetical protein
MGYVIDRNYNFNKNHQKWNQNCLKIKVNNSYRTHKKKTYLRWLA